MAESKVCFCRREVGTPMAGLATKTGTIDKATTEVRGAPVQNRAAVPVGASMRTKPSGGANLQVQIEGEREKARH